MLLDAVLQYYVVNRIRKSAPPVDEEHSQEMGSVRPPKHEKSSSARSASQKTKSHSSPKTSKKQTPQPKPQQARKGKSKGAAAKEKKAPKKTTKVTKQGDDTTSSTSTSTLNKIIDLYEPTPTKQETKATTSPPVKPPTAGKLPNLAVSANELAKQKVVDWYLVHL
ncbi:hypothetical protein COOONC_18282 [Cooperia oncophora]